MLKITELYNNYFHGVKIIFPCIGFVMKLFYKISHIVKTNHFEIVHLFNRNSL